jgi:hypothetical protein
MTEDDIIQFVTNLDGVAKVTPSQANGAPEVAWGDSFFFYDLHGDIPAAGGGRSQRSSSRTTRASTRSHTSTGQAPSA